MPLRLLKKEASHEDVFLERYSSMLTWARNLTKNDADLAEDLVQEAFIQFTLTAPSLNEINNLDGYLYGLLRNICLSHFRRISKNRIEQLSIYEYDSAADGLETIDLRDQENARDILQQICSFLSIRKNSARAASVFILRFFHGYFPSEIARVLRTSRPAVDVRLMTARKEIRAFLDNPKDVKFIGIDDSLRQIFQAMPVETTRKQDEFLSQLRAVIFKFREGKHQSKEQLREFYEKEQASAIDVGQLSHLVSCPQCLDEVNLMLKLPKLSSRFPTDAIGRDKKKNGNDDDSSGTSCGSFSKLSQKVRRVFEHKPAEIRIIVNGVLQGSLKANAELNELKLNLSNTEKVEFIEVFSEQQVRLLMLNVEKLPPIVANNQIVSVPLSEERQLDLQLNFVAQGVELQLVYHDPTYNQVAAMLANPALLENEVEIPRLKAVEEVAADSLWIRWQETIRGINFSTRLAVVSLAILFLAALLITRFPYQSVSASELFQRSEAMEKLLGKITYRKMSIKTTSINPNKDYNLMTVEEWSNPLENLKLRRVYNEKGELIVITKFSGKQISSFTSDTVKPVMPLTPIIPPQLVKFRKTGEGGMSVEEFKQLIGNVNKAEVEEKSDTFSVNYSDREKALKVAITLEKESLRPISQRFEFLFKGKSHSYEFTEIGFEAFEPNAVIIGVFEINEGYHESSSRNTE